MPKIQIGDKVTYKDKEYVVRDTGLIGGEKVVWLRGKTGWIYEKDLHLSAKMIEHQEYVAAKIKDGKITEMKVLAAKIQNGKVVEMKV